MSSKSPTTSTEFLSISSPTKEATIPNLIIEELPDTFISYEKEQIVIDYEVLSKSSDGNASDISIEEGSQKDHRKRSVDDDFAEVGGLIIEEVHDVESIAGKGKIECAAIIEEMETHQDASKKGNGDGSPKFKKNKKRKVVNDKRGESTV